MARDGIGDSVPGILLFGTLGAAAGAIGTLAIQRLLPEAKPGDGFTVRWLDKDGIERRAEYGQDEKGALEKAIDLGRQYPGVEVIEIRQGIVRKVSRAGARPQEVV